MPVPIAITVPISIAIAIYTNLFIVDDYAKRFNVAPFQIIHDGGEQTFWCKVLPYHY